MKKDIIINADAAEALRSIPADSVDMCVTSPPYFGLRDYGIDGQIGLESTTKEYIGRLVSVFHEVKRVMRDDGTLWVNIGDCYATGTKAGRKQSKNPGVGANRPEAQNSVARIGNPEGCKTKDLIGIPYQSGVRALFVGGYWNSASAAGPFALTGNEAPSISSSTVGSRIQKLPSKAA